MAKPQLIASEDPKLQTNFVRIAFMDPRTSKIDFVSLNKDVYLKTGAVNQAVIHRGPDDDRSNDQGQWHKYSDPGRR